MVSNKFQVPSYLGLKTSNLAEGWPLTWVCCFADDFVLILPWDMPPTIERIYIYVINIHLMGYFFQTSLANQDCTQTSTLPNHQLGVYFAVMYITNSCCMVYWNDGRNSYSKSRWWITPLNYLRPCFYPGGFVMVCSYKTIRFPLYLYPRTLTWQWKSNHLKMYRWYLVLKIRWFSIAMLVFWRV